MLKKFFSQLTQTVNKTDADPLAALTLPELIKLSVPAKQVDLTSRKLVATTFAGDKLAVLRGRGMDFDESRVYQPGDDIRLIDWRVTARNGTTHTKIYREERERPIYCFTDFTPSMWFGTRNTFKAVIAAQAASLIAWAAVEHNDRVGGVICSDKKTWAIKPASGKRGVLQLLNLFSEQQVNIKPSLNTEQFTHALLQLRHVAKPGSLVFIFTDAANMNKKAEMHLARLSQHCEVLLGFVYDPLEVKLPEHGIYSLSNGEQQISFDSRDKKFATEYKNLFTERFDTIQQLTRRYKIPLFTLQTDESPIDAMQRVFATRKGQH